MPNVGDDDTLLPFAPAPGRERQRLGEKESRINAALVFGQIFFARTR